MANNLDNGDGGSNTGSPENQTGDSASGLNGGIPSPSDSDAGLSAAGADADSRFSLNPAGEVTTPCEKAKGTPAAIGSRINSIVCMNGNLVVQNNNAEPDRACTQAHEGSHIQDWKDRYGEDLCKGVPDGRLPVGGEGYHEFLRQSECKAYKVGKACREKLLTSADDKDKAAIQNGIDRDNAQIKSNKCD